MRNAFIFLAIFLLLTGNSAVISLAYGKDYQKVAAMPVPDGEETQEEQSRNVVEEDDHKFDVDHPWISKEKSSETDLHFIYQDVIFHALELEVVVPPPKA